MRALAFLAAISISAAAQAETLVAPAPEGFRLDLHLSTDMADIQEFFPAGQNRDDWREMVSVQTFPGLVGIDPAAFLAGVADTAQAGCTDARADLVAQTVEAGRAVAVALLSCPDAPGAGGPETMIAKVMAGQDALYVVQAAWRGQPTASALDQWFGYFLDVGLCTADCAADRAPQ